jgi:hypothetical protein
MGWKGGAEASAVFSTVFFIVWAGSAVVTVNSQLLGGKISFFQSVCVLGYCIFPLNIASIVALFTNILWIKAIVAGVTYFWSITGTENCLV